APFLVIHFANDGQFHQVDQAALIGWPGLTLLAVAAGAGGFLMSRTTFPNGWFMGPLLACALISMAGLLGGRGAEHLGHIFPGSVCVPLCARLPRRSLVHT